MPLERLKQTYSDDQLKRALLCVVYSKDGGYVVWNPETSTEHFIKNGWCDCTGFQVFGKCYHLLATQLKEQRDKDLTVEQAISELFDF